MDWFQKWIELPPLGIISSLVFTLSGFAYFLTLAGRPRKGTNKWFWGAWEGNLGTGKIMASFRTKMTMLFWAGLILFGFSVSKNRDNNILPNCWESEKDLEMKSHRFQESHALFYRTSTKKYYILDVNCTPTSKMIMFKTDKVFVIEDFKNGIIEVLDGKDKYRLNFKGEQQ